MILVVLTDFSMGALLSHETAVLLKKEYGREPEHMYLSGMSAPHVSPFHYTSAIYIYSFCLQSEFANFKVEDPSVCVGVCVVCVCVCVCLSVCQSVGLCVSVYLTPYKRNLILRSLEVLWTC